MIWIFNFKKFIFKSRTRSAVRKAPADTDTNTERRIRVEVKQFFWSQNILVAHTCVDEGHSVWEEPENMF